MLRPEVLQAKAQDVLEAANDSQKAWRAIWKAREGIPDADAVDEAFVRTMQAWVSSQQQLGAAFTELIEGADRAATPTLAALCMAATRKA